VEVTGTALGAAVGLGLRVAAPSEEFARKPNPAGDAVAPTVNAKVRSASRRVKERREEEGAIAQDSIARVASARRKRRTVFAVARNNVMPEK
jgi:hypothetical protein